MIDGIPKKKLRHPVLAAFALFTIAAISPVAADSEAFVGSVPVQFDWDQAKGFTSIGAKPRLPVPFVSAVIAVQARRPIAAAFKAAGWQCAKGRLDVRVFLYVFVLGIDSEQWSAEIIDPKTTPLMVAAENGDLAEVQRLLAQGAKVNAQDQRGWTPLMHAAFKDHATEASALLRVGANPNQRDRAGRTALLWASQDYAPEVAETLLGAGARLDVRDDYGESASDYAACPGIARVIGTHRPNVPLDRLWRMSHAPSRRRR